MSTMEAIAELELIQNQILDRISKIEVTHLSHHFSVTLRVSSANTTRDATTEARLSTILRDNGVTDFSFKRVPFDYYDWTLEARRDALAAYSIHHLCKSIVLVNTQAPSNVIDCSDPNNSKYYVVVVQYTARFNAETVKNFLYSLNNGKISKKKFNLRLAPEEMSAKLTGYGHNGVTCIGMRTDIPTLMFICSSVTTDSSLNSMSTILWQSCSYIESSNHYDSCWVHSLFHTSFLVILDEAIVKLNPDYFWLGGGEVDLKLGIRTSQFMNFVKPFVVNCSGT